MRRFGLLGILLQPSILSATLCCIVAGALLGGANHVYVYKTATLYTHIFGQYGTADYLQQAPRALLTDVLDASSKHIVYDIIVAVVALLAGAITYLVIESLYRMRVNTARMLRTLEDSSGPASIRHETLERLGLLIGIVIGGGVYGGLLVRILVPFCLLLAHDGAQR